MTTVCGKAVCVITIVHSMEVCVAHRGYTNLPPTIVDNIIHSEPAYLASHHIVVCTGMADRQSLTDNSQYLTHLGHRLSLWLLEPVDGPRGETRSRIWALTPGPGGGPTWGLSPTYLFYNTGYVPPGPGVWDSCASSKVQGTGYPFSQQVAFIVSGAPFQWHTCDNKYIYYTTIIVHTAANGENTDEGIHGLQVTSSVNGMEQQGTLEDVYYTPGIHVQLVSLGKLESQGWDIHLWKDWMVLRDWVGDVFAEIDKVNNIYLMELRIVPPRKC